MPTATPIKYVYAVVSPDRYLRRDALDQLLVRLRAASGDALDVATFRGPESQLADVLDEARTPSLWGGVRAVVVDDADDFITRHRPALERFCATPADTAVLVLVAQTMPSNTRLYKVIAKAGEVLSVKPPERQAVAAWITQRAQTAYGKKVPSEVARRLKEQVGDAPGVLDAELAKLADFVGERQSITVDDIQALCGHTREEQVFAVMDAMLEGDAPEALKQWNHVLATNRAAPALAVAGLASTVRRTLQAKQEFESGVSAYSLARKLFADPRTVERRLQGCDRNMLIRMQRDLLNADLAIKTGAAEVGNVIERFIVSHSTRERGRSGAA